MTRRIYADHAATTPPAAEVLEAMRPWLDEAWGNPSSLHARGVAARDAVEAARARVAALLGARAEEVVFTSSGSEANNLALQGWMAQAAPDRRHVVTSTIEHASVHETALHLESMGIRHTLVAVDGEGRLDLAALEAALDPGVGLVSVMAANNETGTIQPIAEVVAAARAVGARVHVDAVQAVGKVPIDVEALGVDLLSLAGHKFHGPPGGAALYVRRRVRLTPLLHGGHQERGRRAGTENVAAIVGLGVAAERAGRDLDTRADRVRRLGEHLLNGLRAHGARLNGPQIERLPGIVNVELPGVDGEAVLHELDRVGIAVSTGSACSAASPGPSRILMAMGRTAAQAHASVRFSLGDVNTEADIEYILQAVPEALARLHALGGPQGTMSGSARGSRPEPSRPHGAGGGW